MSSQTDEDVVLRTLAREGGRLKFSPRERPDRASAKITWIGPRVATISDRKWAGVARSLVEMLTVGRANIRFATTAPPTRPAI